MPSDLRLSICHRLSPKMSFLTTSQVSSTFEAIFLLKLHPNDFVRSPVFTPNAFSSAAPIVSATLRMPIIITLPPTLRICVFGFSNIAILRHASNFSMPVDGNCLAILSPICSHTSSYACWLPRGMFCMAVISSGSRSMFVHFLPYCFKPCSFSLRSCLSMVIRNVSGSASRSILAAAPVLPASVSLSAAADKTSLALAIFPFSRAWFASSLESGIASAWWLLSLIRR